MKKHQLLRIFIFNFSILFTQFAFAQKSDAEKNISGTTPIKDISKSNYISLKKQGALSENYEYRIDNGKVIYFNPVAKPYSPTSSTLTPCDIVPVQGSVGYNVEVDDSPLLTIPIPFNFCFYGTNYTSLKLSANGNVQFSSNSTSFSSTGFPSTAVNMIAPFWADGESMVLFGGRTYGKIHIDPHPTYMVISWDSMGYYNNHVDKLNSFQLVLTNGLDPILPPGKNVGFYYKKMQWTTGDASSGTNGFPTTQPGTPATIGANQGNGVDYFLIGRFGVPGSVYDGPLGNSDGISWLNGKRFFFDVCPPVGSNQAPTPTLIGPCDTIKLCGNDSLIIKNAFIGPELTQTVSINANAPTLGSSFTYSVLQTGNNTDISMFVNGNTAPAGYHVVTMNATDNGVPAKTSSQTFVVFVDQASVNNLNGQIVFTPTIGVCPGGSTTASIVVSGGTPGSYLWNNNASTASTSFTVTPALDSTVYVTIKSGQCQKTFMKYIKVNPVPVASISGNLQFCSGTSSTTILTASNTTNFATQSPYTYAWSGTPTAPSPVNTQTTNATGGTYSVIVTNKYNCKSTAVVTVTLNTTPVFTVVPTNTTVCSSAVIPLSINFGSAPPVGCGLASTGCSSASTRTIGAGTSTNGSTSFPTPYSNYFKSSHFQMLFKASELTSAGVVAGKISSIAFNISSLNSFSVALKNYTIKMKCTSVTAMTSTFDNTGLSQVYFNNSYMPTSGINTHNYSQAYQWDGSSNILIDICYDMFTPGNYVFNGSASAFYTATTFFSVRHDESDTQDLCGTSTSASTSSNRPNVRFGNCQSTPTASEFSYSWLPTAGLSSASVSNPTASISASIQYTVVVTPTAATTCSNVGTTSLTVISPATPTITSVPALCSNAASFTLSALPSGGTWSLTTATSTLGVFTPSLAAIGSNTITYTYGGTGCVQTTTAIVTVERFVPSTITGTINPICLPSPAINLATALPTSTLGVGVWSGNGVTGTTFDPVAAGAGTHTLTYSTNSSPTASLCPSTSTIAVTLNSVPQPTIASAGPLCTNASTLALSGAPSGGTWFGSGVSSSGILTPSLAAVGNNTYTYTVGSSTCSVINTTTISIEQYVPSTITGTINPICLPSPAINLTTALPTSTLGTGVWFGNGVSGTAFDPAIAGAGTHTLTYSTNSSPTASLCPSSSTTEVNINSVAQPIINQAGPFCTNASTFALTVTPAGGTWSGTGGVSSSGVLTPSLATVGNNTYTYTVGSATCSAVNSTTVSIEQYVPSTITGTINPVCISDPMINLATALTTSTLGVGFWSGNGVTGTVFDPSVASSGVHTLTYSSQSNPTATLCPSFSVIAVAVNSVVQPTITPAGPFCDNYAPQQITANPAGGVWSASAGSSVSASGLFTPSPILVGSNKLYYTVTNAPCIKKDSISVDVIHFVPATIIGALGPYCRYNAPVYLQGIAQFAGGVWSGTGVSSGSFTPSAALAPTAVTAGTFVITYITNPSPLLNCGETRTTSILVNPKPEANAFPDSPGGCNYLVPILFSTSTVNTGTATWNFGDGSPIGNGLMVTHTYTNPGTYIATITYTDNAGCMDTTQIPTAIIIFPVPDAAFEPSLDVTTVINAEIVFTNQTSDLPDNAYNWNFGGLGTSTETSPTYLFDNSGEYFITLIAVSPDGCQDTAVKKITVNPDVVLYVPNAFTPGNSDGLNDVFQIFLPPTGVDYTTFSLSIYDRWGELIFKTNDVNDSWTGAKNNSGPILKQEIFVWKIEFQDEKKKFYSKMGHVSLLRK